MEAKVSGGRGGEIKGGRREDSVMTPAGLVQRRK